MTGRWKRAVLLKVLYPVSMFIGAFLKNKKDNLRGMIISLNNRLVRNEHHRAKKLLILLPHCLQVDDCNIRLTHNVRNCEQCGNCGIKDLIGLADRKGLELHVATGGNLARRIVKDVMPDAVIAVACEHDLSSGIADTYPLPVLGIPNERPFGPCINTKVDMSKVEEAIELLSGRG